MCGVRVCARVWCVRVHAYACVWCVCSVCVCGVCVCVRMHVCGVCVVCVCVVCACACVHVLFTPEYSNSFLHSSFLSLLVETVGWIQ